MPAVLLRDMFGVQTSGFGVRALVLAEICSGSGRRLPRQQRKTRTFVRKFAAGKPAAEAAFN